MTAIYGVLGHPVEHSLSPAMFEAAFWQYDIDAEYKKFDIEPEKLPRFLEEVRAKDIRGLSITIPHKEAMLPLLDQVDDKAKAIGAVNTLVNRNRKLKGYNTDYLGALKALEEVTEIDGKRVLVLGAGGAAAAIIYGCVEHGARVTVLNRNLNKAEELAEKFNAKAGVLEDILSYPADILVHATSVGMPPHTKQSLVPVEYFKRGMIVMDTVYNPFETKLVREARAAECRIVHGYKMLLYQAERQFEIWFKKKPPLEKMEKALLEGLTA